LAHSFAADIATDGTIGSMSIKTPRTKVIKAASAAAISRLGASVWHIHEPAFAQLAAGLQAMAETGQSLDRIAASAESSADLLIPRGEYSRNVQRSGGVAIIPITGVLEPERGVYTDWMGGSNCAQIRSDIRMAAADSSVTQIALLIDSPGGIAMGLQETASLIAKVSQSKPVVAYCRNLTASAAYFLACAASRIVATPSTAVGSVGSIIGHFSYSGMLEQAGIKYTQITHGENKGEGSSYLPLDKKSEQGLQDFVTAYGSQFVNYVAERRGVSVEQVMQKFGQGRVYIASEALDRGMIDGIGMIEEALAARGSGTSAGFSPGSATSPAGESVASERPKVKKLVALMYALGLVQSMDASEEAVNSALNAFCFARNIPVPMGTDGKLDEAKCLALLQPTPAAAAPNVAAAHRQEQAEARQEMTAKQYKARRDEVVAIARSMNHGRAAAVVSQEQITAATDSEKSFADIREEWVQKLESSDDGRSVPAFTGSITAGSSGEDRFAATAVNAMLARMGHRPSAEVPRDMRGMTLMQIGSRCAQLSGLRLSGTSEDQALQILQGSPELTVFSGDPSYNRPADFANLLSNLAGKILDEAMDLAEATFPLWTQRMMDVPDFKPKTVMGASVFDNLDVIDDDDKTKQLRMAEELRGWYETARYGNHVALTPVMMANDDLDAFNQMLNGLGMAHDLTLNGLCLALLAGNVTLVDGIALFNASHSNLVSGGGVPAEAQAKKNKLLHRAQTATGSIRTLNSRPRVVLVPYALEDDALKTYLTIAELAQIAGGETKVAATDSNINVHRGTVRVVVEPGLDAYSAAAWYTFDDRLRTIVHGFQTGYGRGGRRTTWFNPETESRYIKLEGRFGAAAVGYRGAVKNPGS
jgi:capsid assembly protease